MNVNIPPYKELITAYIQAKDENRPWYLTKVFSSDAVLEMKVESDVIDFPAEVFGREAIPDILVKNFSQTYDNVFTFVFDDSVTYDGMKLSCMWLVIMTKKDDGSLRVGYGKYTWYFKPNSNQFLVPKLRIEIISMNEFPLSFMDSIYNCVEVMPYPWIQKSDCKKLVHSIPDLSDLIASLDF